MILASSSSKIFVSILCIFQSYLPGTRYKWRIQTHLFLLQKAVHSLGNICCVNWIMIRIRTVISFFYETYKKRTNLALVVIHKRSRAGRRLFLIRSLRFVVCLKETPMNRSLEKKHWKLKNIWIKTFEIQKIPIVIEVHIFRSEFHD